MQDDRIHYLNASLILVFGLTPIVVRDSDLNKQQKRIMTGIIGLILVLLAQNVAEYILQTAVSMPYLRTLESIVGYSVRPVIIILFCKLVKPNGKYRIAWILAIYNAAVYFTATFSRFAFYIDENNHFHGGFLYFGKTVITNTLDTLHLDTVETYYIDEDGAEQTVTARRISSDIPYFVEGWYVVDEDVEIPYNVILMAYGDVKLILADGKTMSFAPTNGYSAITDYRLGSAFTLYGQSGTLDCANRTASFDDFKQYGGNFKSESGVSAGSSMLIARGTLHTSSMSFAPNAYISGGNVTVGSTAVIEPIKLGWTADDGWEIVTFGY